MGDFFQEPPTSPHPGSQKSMDAQVPYTKQHRAMHIVSPAQGHIPNHGLKITYIFIKAVLFIKSTSFVV